MNIIPYIFYPLTIGLVIFTVAFFKYTRYAIAGLIIAKPIIDLTWDYRIFLNINFLQIYAGLFVILGVVYIIYHRLWILNHPISILWMVFLGLNVVSIFVISGQYLLIGKISYFLRILTGFVALILFAYIFDYEKHKKFFISVFVIAGIFPILLWLIPVIIGNPIISNDALRRIMGPYQNFWNFNFYALQTIIFCLAYLSLKSSSFSKLRPLLSSNPLGIQTVPAQGAKFQMKSHFHPEPVEGLLPNQRSHKLSLFLPSKLHSIIKSPFLRLSVSLKSIFVLFMLFVSIAMIYKCHGKIGWVTLFICFLLWFLLRKKWILTALLLVVTACIIFVSPFSSDFKKTFSNEIKDLSVDINVREYLFRGRLNKWITGMKIFNTTPLINRLFGVEESIGNPENDYFRVLWDNGIFGFISYITLLCLTGYFLISRFAGTKEVVMLMGILVFAVFLINSIGSYAMYRPALQWFVWGSVGFTLNSKPR